MKTGTLPRKVVDASVADRAAKPGSAGAKPGSAGAKPGSASTPPGSGAAPDGKREQNKAQNRAEILQAARLVFAELGYDAATVRDIVRRTALASGTFYNYFNDKEAVFRALLAEAEERRRAWLSRASLRTSSYQEYLADAFRAYFEFVAADPTMFDLLRRNAGTIRALSGDPLIIGWSRKIQEDLAGQMRRGKLPWVDPEYLASAVVGVSFEVAVIMVDRDPVDVEGATAFAIDLFVGCMERAQRSAQR
jgi:AcrR family transcriptional regulator